MSRLSGFCYVLLALLIPQAAFSQVNLSEDALHTLQNFESYRARTCSQKRAPQNIEYELDLDMKEILQESVAETGSLSNPSQSVEIEAAPAGASRYNYTGLAASLSCPLDYSITYLLVPLEPNCRQMRGVLSPLCVEYFAYEADRESDAKYLFAASLESLFQRDEYYPWQVMTAENGPADKIGLTLVQNGNISLKITAYLEAFPVEKLSGIRKKKISSRLKKLDLDLVKEGFQYFPMIKFEIGTAGISASNYYLEIYRTNSMNPATDKLYAINGRKMKWDQFWFHSIFLYAVAEKDFRKTTYFIIKAFPSEDQKDQPLLEMKINNAGFSSVWDHLLAHYKAVSPETD